MVEVVEVAMDWPWFMVFWDEIRWVKCGYFLFCPQTKKHRASSKKPFSKFGIWKHILSSVFGQLLVFLA